jgi:hypothetical protein
VLVREKQKDFLALSTTSTMNVAKLVLNRDWAVDVAQYRSAAEDQDE